MACSTYNQQFLTACLNGDPGVARVYVADFYNILSYTTDTATGVILSGLTCSGTTGQKAFWRIELLQDVGSSVDTPTISVPNGVAISIPTIKLKLAHLDQYNLNAFNLFKKGRCVLVWENMESTLFCTGIQRGLFMSAGTAGTDETTFEGITVELKGKEPFGNYILTPALQTTFVSTYVN